MNPLRWLPLAVLLLPFHAPAQTGNPCPELPAGAGLSWQAVDGADFTYCKAIRDDDGHQVFAVMLRAEPVFRTRRSLREGDPVVIDGREVYWYRGEVPNAIVRETLVELGKDSSAHIVVNVATEAELARTQQLAQGLRFHDVRLGSN